MVKRSPANPITEPVGSRRTFENGAVAEVVAVHKKDGTEGKRLRIISGATKTPNGGPIGRGKGSGGLGLSHKRRSISPQSAKAAFTRYWNARWQAAKAVSPLNARGVKSAWARDILYSRPQVNKEGKPLYVRENTTYLRNPGKYEYPGVDMGGKRYKTVEERKYKSDKSRNALATGRSHLGAKGSAERLAAARKAADTRYSRLSPAAKMRADKRHAATRSGGMTGGYYF